MRLRTLLLVICVGLPEVGEATSQWGDLVPGPHAVGYTTIRARDARRHYFDDARPVQLFVWYPAVVDASATRMPYEGYFEDVGFDWGEAPDRVAYLRQQALDGFRRGALNPSFPGALTDGQFQQILTTPTAVVRNAAAAPGRFPVLLHAHMNGALHQSVMLEYLASHGYVVLSVSTYNTAPAFYGRGDDTADALLNLAEDFSLMLSRAGDIANADVGRAAVVGMLAHGGLALQMKAVPLKAIACVECLGYADALQQLPFYDPRRIRIPVLELINSEHDDGTTGQQSSFIDRFTSAARYVGRFTGVRHADFYPFPKVARPGTPHPRYDAVLYTLLEFLEAALHDRPIAPQDLERAGLRAGMRAGFLRVSEARPVRAMPTESEFLAWLRYGDMTRVRDAWKIFGANLVTRPRMFATVLFLARDDEPQAEEAVAMLRTAYPAMEGTPEARQDALLTRVLAARAARHHP